MGIDPKGRTSNGKVAADNVKAARSKVQEKNLTVLKIKQVGSLAKEGRASNASPHSQKKEKSSLKGNHGAKGEKVGLELLKRLHELHASGMPVADAVKLLNQRLSDPQQKFLAGVLWRDLSEGRTLSRGNEKFHCLF